MARRIIGSLHKDLSLKRFFSDGCFNTVPQVFEKIGSIADGNMVNSVGAIFQFNILDDAKIYFVDMKNGSGKVGEGQSPVKPDVTIVLESDTLLKMFNRELQPTSAFMTGKLTVKGDFSKAMALGKVLKAARE